MSREGLRTLVVGKKILTEEQFASFDVRGVSHNVSICNLV